MDGFLRVGRVLGPHGVRGWIRCRPYSSPDLFAVGRDLRLCRGDSTEVVHTFRIVESGAHGGVLRLRLEGVAGREAAEALAGAEAVARRDELPAAEEDAYYWDDLVGLRVYEAGANGSDEDRFLGRLESIIETGSNDVYVVRDGERETLVPALVRVVERVDLAAGTMHVNLPEGL